MIADVIKNEVFAKLGCKLSDAKLLGGYNSNVFEVNGDADFIVKILERSVIAVPSLLSEFEWLDYLYSNGLNVVKPLRVHGETYIIDISDDFYFVAYEKVSGIHVNPQDKEVWNKELFEKWGEIMGRLHSLAKSYRAKNERPKWFQNDLFNEITVRLEPFLSKKWSHYYDDFQKLSAFQDNFGLIHGDLHHQNFLVNGKELTLIDFGDSEYNWFAYDIAIAVYHTAQTVQKGKEREQFVRSFFSAFMNGYSRGNSNTELISQIDYFIDYRHLFSYTYHSLYLDRNQLTEQQLLHLDEMRLSLVNETSFLGFTLLE